MPRAARGNPGSLSRNCNEPSSIWPRVPDARIQYAIQYIHQQIDADNQGCNQQNAALYHWIIAPANCIDHPFTDSGHENIVSVNTAPASKVPVCRPTTVTTGISALRNACTTITRNGDSPLARAVRM